MKNPKAELWQVWALNARGGYFLVSASKRLDRAMVKYRKYRDDYTAVELRTPIGDVLESHDKSREPDGNDRAEMVERFGVHAIDYIRMQ